MTPYNIKSPAALVSDAAPELIYPLSGEFSAGANEKQTMISALRATTTANSGKPKNAMSWLGLAQTYFVMLDPAETKNGKGIGFSFGCHMLPGGNPAIFNLRDELETLLFKKLKLHE